MKQEEYKPINRVHSNEKQAMANAQDYCDRIKRRIYLCEVRYGAMKEYVYRTEVFEDSKSIIATYTPRNKAKTRSRKMGMKKIFNEKIFNEFYG